MRTYYIRSSEGFCLVKLSDEVASLSYENQSTLALQEAEELGICPAGIKLIQGIVEQDDFWYGRKWTEEQAKEFKHDPTMLARIR